MVWLANDNKQDNGDDNDDSVQDSINGEENRSRYLLQRSLRQRHCQVGVVCLVEAPRLVLEGGIGEDKRHTVVSHP